VSIWFCSRRADVLAKGGVATFLNVLVRDETDGAPIADVISGLLNALAEGSADITQQVTSSCTLFSPAMLFSASQNISTDVVSLAFDIPWVGPSVL
jgi:hypothetical protein